ncbi:MAG: hypothetical protein AAF349_00290 [Cyanobacteria bacterium P01_A01_bin.68]
MTNIRDYPESTEPSDIDWILIQENSTIPAYKKARLINIRGSNVGTGSTTGWIYRDGSVDFSLDTSTKLLIDTPRDVSIDLDNLPDGAVIEIKRVRQDNSLFITGISKIKGNNIDVDSSIKIPFEDNSSRLIYFNSSLGWFFLPESSVTVLSPLSLPTEGLNQLFNAASITASEGDSVVQWNDEIGNNHAIQNSVNSQAQFVESIFAESTIGGVLFTGFQEYETDLSYLVNQKYTIAIVEKRSSNNQLYIIGNTSGNTNSGLHVGYRGDTEFTLAQYGNDLDASISPYDGLSQANLWVVSNNSRGKEIYKNGVLISSNSNTDDLVEANTGRIGSALGSFYQGYLGLLAIWIGGKTINQLADINDAVNSTFKVY